MKRVRDRGWITVVCACSMCLDAIDPKVVVSILIRKAKKKCCELQCASVKLKGIKDGRWKGSQ